MQDSVEIKEMMGRIETIDDLRWIDGADKNARRASKLAP